MIPSSSAPPEHPQDHEPTPGQGDEQLEFLEAHQISLDPRAFEVMTMADAQRLSAVPLSNASRGPVIAVASVQPQRLAAIRDLTGPQTRFVQVAGETLTGLLGSRMFRTLMAAGEAAAQRSAHASAAEGSAAPGSAAPPPEIVEELRFAVPRVDELSAETDRVTERPEAAEQVDLYRQEPEFHEPVLHEPVFHEPVLDEPVVHETVLREPVLQEPVPEEPEHQVALVHDEPVEVDLEPTPLRADDTTEVVSWPSAIEPSVIEPAVGEPSAVEPSPAPAAVEQPAEDAVASVPPVEFEEPAAASPPEPVASSEPVPAQPVFLEALVAAPAPLGSADELLAQMGQAAGAWVAIRDQIVQMGAALETAKRDLRETKQQLSVAHAESDQYRLAAQSLEADLNAARASAEEATRHLENLKLALESHPVEESSYTDV